MRPVLPAFLWFPRGLNSLSSKSPIKHSVRSSDGAPLTQRRWSCACDSFSWQPHMLDGSPLQPDKAGAGAPVTQVLWVPPRERRSHYLSPTKGNEVHLMALRILSRFHSFTRRQREYSILVPLHIRIHTWQQPPSNHLLANHVLCPRRNLEVSALVTPRVFLEGNEPFSSLNTLALPLSAAVIPALHSSWLSCFGRGLSVGMKTTMCLKILETCLAKWN